MIKIDFRNGLRFREYITIARELFQIRMGINIISNFGNLLSSSQVSWSSSSSSFTISESETETVKETRNLEVEQPGHLDHRPLHVTSQNGSIKINIDRSFGSKVKIVAKIRAKSEKRLAQVQIKCDRNSVDDSLEVEAIWPGKGRKSNEGCDFEIDSPSVENVFARTNNGNIRLTGAGGVARLTSSNGKVSVQDHSGSVNLTTCNGYIEARSVSGDADLSTSNASIGVFKVGGAINARSSNGSIKINLKEDWTGNLTLHTSNGHIKLDDQGLKNLAVITKSKSHAELQVGPPGKASSGAMSNACTSNGSIILN